MVLENIILGEIKSDREREIWFVFHLHVESKTKKKNKKSQKKIPRNIDQRDGYQKGVGGG